jgi:hypothetical protein
MNQLFNVFKANTAQERGMAPVTPGYSTGCYILLKSRLKHFIQTFFGRKNFITFIYKMIVIEIWYE